MANHIGRLNAPVTIGVGAAFDFLSGTKKQAPKWVQKSGFEWLFRLASEPKRLWRRYIEYPKFVLLVLLQLLRFKHYPMKNTCICENHEYNDN
jgi:N-acetylglucosaminyldiphosphoundecaprenol N-acetyl-beta-D-mannosaminyltransferase